MLSIIVKELKFSCIQFHFVLWSFCLFNFLNVSHAAKKKYNFLFSYKLYTSSWVFLLIFFSIWSFIYWTLNKQSLKTWSCVCCYCTYGLFLCFRLCWNIPKNARKLGVGHRKFDAGVNGLKHFLKRKVSDPNSLEKSFNFIVSPWKVLDCKKSSKSPWIPLQGLEKSLNFPQHRIWRVAAMLHCED